MAMTGGVSTQHTAHSTTTIPAWLGWVWSIILVCNFPGKPLMVFINYKNYWPRLTGPPPHSPSGSCWCDLAQDSGWKKQKLSGVPEYMAVKSGTVLISVMPVATPLDEVVVVRDGDHQGQDRGGSANTPPCYTGDHTTSLILFQNC